MKKGLVIGLILVIAVQFSGIGYLGFKLTSLEKNVYEKAARIDSLETKLGLLGSIVKKADDKNTGMIERTNISAALCSGYVVTSKIVVQYGHMELGADVVDFDIKPQPSYSKYFEGQGKINLSDRNIKASLSEAIKIFDSFYSDWQKDSNTLPFFEKLTIRIFENGYEVGSFKSGKIKLAGE